MDQLASHIWSLAIPSDHRFFNTRVADNIRKDPQAHIDALVEAGVLRLSTQKFGVKFESAYVVVQPEPPHEHGWYAACFGGDGLHTWIVWRCHDCPAVQRVNVLTPEGNPY